MLNISIPPFTAINNLEDLAKNLKIKLECLYNPFYDYPLVYPSDMYPIIANPMKNSDEIFHIDLKLNNPDNYKVNILQYNEYYPNYMVNPRIQYRLVFAALKGYVEQNQSKVRVLGFLEFYSRTSNWIMYFVRQLLLLVEMQYHFSITIVLLVNLY